MSFRLLYDKEQAINPIIPRNMVICFDSQLLGAYSKFTKRNIKAMCLISLTIIRTDDHPILDMQEILNIESHFGAKD